MQTESKKHSAIQNLAEEKLNTVYCHISKALNDDFISEDEFEQVHDDIESYRREKEDIISQHKKHLFWWIALQNILKNKLREKLRSTLIKT